MKYAHSLSRLLATSILLALPLSAHASGTDISDMFLGVIDVMFGTPALWIAVATLVMIIAGVTMMVSQDESVLQKARSTLGAVAIGAVLVTIITVLKPAQFVGNFYNTTISTTFVINNVVGAEAIGLANWIASISVVVGILMIIVSALRAVLSFGDEAAYQNVRTAVLHLIIGIIVVSGALTIQAVFFDTQEPTELLGLILVPLQVLIGIMTLVAVGIIIYAGFRMIISFGKEDEFSGARSLIIRAIIGLIVLIVSFTLITVILNCFDGSCSV